MAPGNPPTPPTQNNPPLCPTILTHTLSSMFSMNMRVGSMRKVSMGMGKESMGMRKGSMSMRVGVGVGTWGRGVW